MQEGKGIGVRRGKSKGEREKIHVKWKSLFYSMQCMVLNIR